MTVLNKKLSLLSNNLAWELVKIFVRSSRCTVHKTMHVQRTSRPATERPTTKGLNGQNILRDQASYRQNVLRDKRPVRQKALRNLWGNYLLCCLTRPTYLDSIGVFRTERLSNLFPFVSLWKYFTFFIRGRGVLFEKNISWKSCDTVFVWYSPLCIYWPSYETCETVPLSGAWWW